MLHRARTAGAAAAALAVVSSVLLPIIASDSTLRLLTSVFLFVSLAQAWNIIGGFAGYPSFGNVVFFGLGGYAVAVPMAHWGWGFWTAMPIAAAIGAGFAAILGTPLLRLRGPYFAIATLGLAEAMREVVVNLPGLTGGGAGITVPALGSRATVYYPGNAAFYYYALGFALLTVAVVAAISRSRFGYGMRAIHMDENAAAAVGINTTRTKVAAFSTSGAITAVVGALFTFQQVTIYPDRVFSIDITMLIIVMAVIGGAGTVMGPVVGAVTLQLLAEYLRRELLGLHLVVFGAAIIVAVMVLPQGAVRFMSECYRERRLPLLDNVRRYRL